MLRADKKSQYVYSYCCCMRVSHVTAFFIRIWRFFAPLVCFEISLHLKYDFCTKHFSQFELIKFEDTAPMHLLAQQ